MAVNEGAAGQKTAKDEIGGDYAKYVLGVLVLVYIFNFIDRQILSILAEDIKADLGISDAQIGFLYGTAFAVFYAVFGIPLGRLADVWHRTRLISIGLAFWSLMTALSGFARNFGMLAVFRFGVGVGEASATPAAASLLSDYFAPKVRATVLSIYASGIYIGAGIGIFLGGAILDGWAGAFPNPADAPLGIKPWQAAFLAVGLPGLIMAVWVSTLREPKRGQSEGIETPAHPSPFKEAFKELVAVLPPFTLIGLYQSGGAARDYLINLGTGLGIAFIAWGLTAWIGEPLQWAALGVGIYAAFSWAQSLARRDPAAFQLMFGSKTFIFTVIGFPSIAFVTYGIGFWAVPFLIRVHGVSASEVGTFIGLGAAVGGWIGVTMGGVLADKLQLRYTGSRYIIGIAAAALALPVGLLFLFTDNLWVAYVLSFLFSAVAPMWVGPSNTAVIDLVLPRMRAIAIALIIFMSTFVGLALGPFTMGRVSDAMVATGMSDGDALRTGMLVGLSMLALAIAMLSLAWKNLDHDLATKLDRARAAGENI